MISYSYAVTRDCNFMILLSLRPEMGNSCGELKRDWSFRNTKGKPEIVREISRDVSQTQKVNDEVATKGRRVIATMSRCTEHLEWVRLTAEKLFAHDLVKR